MNASRLFPLALLSGFFLGAGTFAAPQPSPADPPWAAGIRAEEAGEWDRALRIYRDVLAHQPEDPALWLRVADIEARLGHPAAAAAAVEQTALQLPEDSIVQYRLAEAYSVAGRPFLALAAADRALELEPRSVDYLRGRAQLANWCGRYELALESYERILEIVEDDPEAALGRARAKAWTGKLDDATSLYRSYVEHHPEDAASRLEYARTEAWRGNYPVSHSVLEAFRQDHGETAGYLDDTARILLGAGRPNAALAILAFRLESQPESFELSADRTLALAASGRPRQANESLEVLARLGADRPRTGEVYRIVRTPQRPSVVPLLDVYRDSDGVELTRAGFEGAVSPVPSSRLRAGVYDAEIRADAGSGLEPAGGRERLEYSGLWLGLSQLLSPRATLEARVGRTEVRGGGDLTTYRLGGNFELSDSVDLSLHRERGFYLVSPRALDLGIENTSHRLRLDWRPGFRYTVELDVAQDSLSDGNDRWEVAVAPRRAFLRRAGFNLDLGLRAWWFGFDQDLDNGYYDPARYESYAVTGFGYWKLSDDSGLSLVLSAGVLSDDTMDGFEFGGNAAIELVTGVYRDWMLKIRASGTENSRVQSGAFNAWGGGIFLTRRFGGGIPAVQQPERAAPDADAAPVDLPSHIARAHGGVEASAVSSDSASPEPASIPPDAEPVTAVAPAAPESRAEPGDAAGMEPPEVGIEPSGVPAAAERIFELQLGLFHHQQNARAMAEDFARRGHPAYLVEVKSSKGETRYTVRVGPYPSMDEALAMAAKLRRAEQIATVIRFRPPPGPLG